MNEIRGRLLFQKFVIALLISIALSYIVGGYVPLFQFCRNNVWAYLIIGIPIVCFSWFASGVVIKNGCINTTFELKQYRADILKRYHICRLDKYLLAMIVFIGFVLRVGGYNWGGR